MLEQRTDEAVMAVVNALEAMAFISPGPADEPTAPAAPVLASIVFAGPVNGRLELIADASLGCTIACNLLGITADDPQAGERGRDALREVLNVACGLLLPSLQDGSADRFQMMLPELHEAGTQAWDQFIAGGSMPLDAEGSPLAVRLVEM